MGKTCYETVVFRFLLFSSCGMPGFVKIGNVSNGGVAFSTFSGFIIVCGKE